VKLFLKRVLPVIIVVILVVVSGMFYIIRGLDSGSRLEVGSVNLSLLSDGTYSGQYKAGRWSNEVNVTIKENKITKIDIVKDVLFSKQEWSQQILNMVLEKQNIDIDAVSGATVTGKAYLKAIEDALKKAE